MTTAEYNTIITQWANSIYRFAFKTINDEEESKDIVQQSFEVLWVKRADVNIDKAKSFLFTVAHRRCMDYFRKTKEVAFEFAPEIKVQNSQINNEWKNYLQEALSILDIQSKQLILLKDYEGYSYQEIGVITSLSENQVKVYLHRARKTLKNYLIQKKELL